jgi:pyruvate dehydrogenase E2 component (dihydrolipoamide acetyltransferase)
VNEILIPSVGVGMTEALVLAWLKEPGDPVAAGEAVVEIETDKATMELESPSAGFLGPHLAEAGSVVPVGMVVAVVSAESDAQAGQLEKLPDSPPAANLPSPSRAADLSPGESEVRTPHRLGPRGRRLRPGQPVDPEGPAGLTGDPARYRKLIAEKVSTSWRLIPHFAVTREVNAEPMIDALEHFRAMATEPRPTMTDLLLRSLALALSATGHERPGDIGLAVATPRGVVIPVVEAIHDLSVHQLAGARLDAVERAMGGRLNEADLELIPVSTLSNLGPQGVDQFTGIIAVGHLSLLTVGRARKRVAVEEDDSIRPRLTFCATLNVDHRSYDGADAARLLVAFAEAAEGKTK